MTRSEFVFTIGFQGEAAIVDKRAQRKYGKLGTKELLEQGLFRAAFCSALFSGDQSEMDSFIAAFGEKTGTSELTVDRVKWLFGIYTVPDEIKKIVTV